MDFCFALHFRQWHKNACEIQIDFVLYTTSCFSKRKLDFYWVTYKKGFMTLTLVGNPATGLRKPEPQ